MLSGVDELIMMKADVLSGMDKIYAATAYKGDSGITEEVPFNSLGQPAEPILKAFDGWQEDITQVKSYTELPEQFKSYIQYTEKEAGVPVSVISVGPDRVQTIRRQNAAKA
jgi:adenylosuccinate synthase